jgi:hypothetical protein
MWLLQHEPDNRDTALDAVLKAVDDGFADRPVEQREQATRRLRALIMLEFAEIGVQATRESGHA